MGGARQCSFARWRLGGLVVIACVLLAGCWRQPEPVLPLAGGWHPAEVDSRARQAVEVAVRQQAQLSGSQLSLIAIDRLEQQVVAGLNHRAALRVRQGDVERRARVVVYEALDGHFELTNWQWLSVP